MAIRSLADLRAAESPTSASRGTSSFSGGERSALAVQNPDGVFPHAARGVPPAGARRVALYSNGFFVDGGEFRPFGVEENDTFVRELRAGVAPREFQAGGGDVHVVLDDRHADTYTPPPPPQYILFGGEGQSLSAGASGGTANQTASVDLSRAAAVAAELAGTDNPQQPRTQILFRLHDGQRAAQNFSVNATIQQLFDFVDVVAPASGGFNLLEGFPPKPITSERNKTLTEAGLLNATLSQKLV